MNFFLVDETWSENSWQSTFRTTYETGIVQSLIKGIVEIFGVDARLLIFDFFATVLKCTVCSIN